VGTTQHSPRSNLKGKKMEGNQKNGILEERLGVTAHQEGGTSTSENTSPIQHVRRRGGAATLPCPVPRRSTS